MAFVVGSLLAVIVILGFIDQDFFQVDHVFRSATIFGIIIAVCRSVIPDEVRLLDNHCKSFACHVTNSRDAQASFEVPPL